jgi:glycosyltransferase involved in cell wall biosynthesis
LGIPPDAFAIGHVGRFSQQKNHAFVIDVFSELIKLEPKAFLLLTGDGELRREIEKKVLEVGLSQRVLFLGSRPDVPHLMQGIMDVFLLPSFYEGLPLVLIEAQAAGLPSVVSDVIPEEAAIVKPLVRRVSLSEPAVEWAKAIRVHRDVVEKHTRSEALAAVKQSEFNIRCSVDSLAQAYSHC